MATRDVGRTQMMQQGATSYKNFKNYYELMTKHDLIREKNDHDKLLTIGERGMKFIDMYEQLMGLFNNKIRE